MPEFADFGRGFNPTLVRLRLSPFASTSALPLLCFNPTLVRLRLEADGKAMRAELKRFNPTLVRLRQFFVPHLVRRLSRVSIPRWFD